MFFLKSLNIKNFRCFKNQKFKSFAEPNGKDEGSGLNILIGENGAGKTAFLEAINLFQSNQYFENQINETDFHSIKEKILISAKTPDYKVLIKGQEDVAKGILYEAKHKDQMPENPLSGAFESLLMFDELKNNYVNNWDKMYRNNSVFQIDSSMLLNVVYFDKNRNYELESNKKNSSIKKLLGNIKFTYLIKSKKNEGNNWSYQSAISIPDQEINPSKEISKIANKLPIIKNSIEEFEYFFPSKKYGKIEFFPNHLLNPFENHFFGVKKGNFNQISIEKMGSGIEIIFIILLIKNIKKYEKGTLIFLIDEAEMKLHPSIQRKFLKTLLKMSINNQIFISTHSSCMFEDALTTSAKLFAFKKNNKTEDDEENENSYIITENFKELKGKFDDGIFKNFPLTVGMVNWMAFSDASREFHSLLYFGLQKITKHTGFIENFEKDILNEYLELPKENFWKKERKKKEKKENEENELKKNDMVTLPTFIRHFNSYPINKNINKNITISQELLKKSTELLIKGIKKSFEKKW